MANYRARLSRAGGAAIVGALVVAGCSSGGDEEAAPDANATAPVESVASETTPDDLPQLGESLVPEQGELLCAPVFESWFGGDGPMLTALMTAGAKTELETHPYVDGVYGLAGSGLDCFITEADSTGIVVNVAEVVFGIVETVPTVTSVVWHELATMPEDVLTRFSATPTLYVPSEAVAGGEEAAPSPTTIPAAAPGGALGDDELAGLQADCVYRADAAACGRLEPAGYGEATNYGLGNSLTQAPDQFLGEDCAAFVELACLELEQRFPSTDGDTDVVAAFVDAVLAADSQTAGIYATESVLAELAQLGGPFGPSDQVEVPGTQQFGDGRFQFTVAPTVFATCYVGGGLVRYCQWSAD